VAKKRPREEEEFTPPAFDEVGYMKKELEGARAAVITILLAVAMAGASALLTIAGLSPVGFILLFIVPFTLKFIFPLGGVKVENLDRKGWAATIAMLIVTWISLWILFINPPFADLTPPFVKEVQVIPAGSQEPLRVNQSGERLVLRDVSEVEVVAFIPDASPVTATFTLSFSDGTRQVIDRQCNSTENRCVVTIGDMRPGLEVTVTIDAVDAHGNRLRDPYIFFIQS
jgi:hypothetical protein